MASWPALTSHRLATSSGTAALAAAAVYVGLERGLVKARLVSLAGAAEDRG